MTLLDKSNISFELAAQLHDDGRFNHSAHHSYYAVLQMMMHVLFYYSGENNDSLYARGVADKTGSHNVIINLFSTLRPTVSKQRRIKDDFIRLKKRREKADYFEDNIEETISSSSLQNSRDLREIILDNYGEHI
jgi:hypothetical protein